MNWKIITAACIMTCTTIAQASNKSEEAFYPTKPGVVMVFEVKDENGKITEQIKDSIISFSGDYNKGVVSATTSKHSSDDVPDIEIEKLILFREGETTLDLVSLTASAMKESIKVSMGSNSTSEEEEEEINKILSNMRIEGECRGIPLHPTVGMKLPSYSIMFKILFITTKIKSTDRKITGQETIKTKAGTFDCYIVEETVTIITAGTREKSKSKTWYARGIGPVKEETYKKKKLVRTNELIEIR